MDDAEAHEALLFPVAHILLSEGVDGGGLPVQFGVPLPRAWCADHRLIRLVDAEDAAYNAELVPVALWPDGSIRWLRVHLRLASAAATPVPVGLRRGAATGLPRATEGLIREEAGALTLCHGARALRVDTRRFRFVSAPSADATGFAELVLAHGTLEGTVDEYSYRTRRGDRGPISAEVCLTGHFADGTDNPLRFRCELCCSPDGERADGRFTIHNPRAAEHPGGLWDLGDPNSALIRALRLGFRLGNGGAEANGGEPVTGGVLRVGDDAPLRRFTHSVRITQHASGGDHWDSPAHVDARGEVPLREPGYVLELDGEISRGSRAQPLLWVERREASTQEAPTRAIGACLPQFWQNFPTAMVLDRGQLTLELFADSAAQPAASTQELQPGERKTRAFTLLFTEAETQNAAATMGQGVARLDPRHLQRCALPGLADPDTVDGRLLAIVREGLDGESGFFAKREAIDEYGWRHFGDLWADHETDGYDGERLFVSHYNNQYDPLFGFLRQYLLEGDPRYLELADDLAHHVTDIDIYHTKEDRAEYNGGLFWHTDHYLQAETATHRACSRLQPEDAYEDHAHGGGPGGQHCYTTGLLYHYLLTGEEASREALFSLRDWVSRVYEGSGRLTDVLLAVRNRGRRDLKNHLTGRYPLDRGTANYLHALMDGYLLDRAPSGLARIDDIVRNTVHPADDVARRALWRVEDNWYYVVFLQALCRYLHLLVEEGIHDGRFCYARDSLLTYADWMLEHEAPYLEKPEILEFPNHTWTAQDLRKANVLYEASRWAPENALAYKQRASEFVDHVATTLREEPTRHYTRIQALLLQNLSPSARPPRASGHSVPPRQSYPAPVLTGPVGQVRRLAGLALRALWHLDPAEELRALRRLLQP